MSGNKKVIEIFAPCDGWVDDIKNLDDPIFSQLVLGDGIYIKPSSNVMNCVIDEGKVSLLVETKHAIYFEKQTIPILMHTGLQSDKYQENSFESLVKVNDLVNHNSKVLSFDKKFLKSLNMATPILVDPNYLDQVEIKKLKLAQEVKQGEVIATITILDKAKVKPKKVKKDYSPISQDIIQFLGGEDNLKNINNCMTRLRVVVHNKDLIQEAKIKEIDIVKGLNWSGDELQIIIGGEVYKVKGNIDFILSNSTGPKTKVSFGKKILSTLSGVISPIIPVLIVTGLLYSLQSILTISKVIVIPESGDLTQTDPLSAIFIASSSVGLAVLGTFFSWSIARYFKGNETMALLIALSLSSHLLLGAGGYLGNGHGVLANDGVGWKLFSIGGQNVYFKSIYGTILPFVGAVSFYLIFDKWVKTWMPVSVDPIFRPFISFITTIGLSFFLFSPFLGMIEQLVGIGAAWVMSIPFGIGSGLLALLMQPIVLLGGHLALFAVFSPSIAAGVPTIYITCVRIAELGQVGALIGVIIRSKVLETRRQGLSFLLPATLGITEPVIYGVNLQKVRPLVIGCIASGIAGVIAGLLNLQADHLGGFGILGVLSFDKTSSMLWFLLVAGISIGLGLLGTLIFYSERVDEYKGLVKIEKQLYKVSSKQLAGKVKIVDWEYYNDFKTIEELVKNNNSNYLELEKNFIKKAKLIDVIKANQAKKIVDENKIQQLQSQLEQVNLNINQLQQLNSQVNDTVINKTKTLIAKINPENKEKLENNLSYFLNSVGVNYDGLELVLMK
ncbi:PTS glucose transporter subunit IIA [Spiroplasma alleghenense]|uniref:PTS system, beta-glucoside-specific IIA component n=1 Tax=Spiroplasma alleghenense TaxID=216931 RepID=A0A345Z4V4_9MOLU|nr:PTS glucose transporter subunit IIA [Spiroplasma alleghenense]AXK51633.1 PTS system, beta-glucoside-specific IIA component [Spiroplasma alleghenense]